MKNDAIAQALLAGHPLDIPVIDAHGHIGSWHQFPMPRSTSTGLVAAMDGIGINHIAISGIVGACGMNPVEGNDMVLDALAHHPDRFIGYAVVTPPDADAALAEFKRCEARGLSALKLHTWHGPLYTDPVYRPTLEYVNARKYPVLLHTRGASDMKMLAELATTYPGSMWILGHTPSDLDGYVALAKRFPNVALETCCSSAPFGLIEYLVAKAGADRVLFGSDAGFTSMAMMIGRIGLANISVADKQKILGENAARIFNLAA